MAVGSDFDWVVEDVPEDYQPDPHNQAIILIRNMTLEEKIGQLLMVAPEDLTGEKRTERIEDPSWLSSLPVGGVIIYGQNIASEQQLKMLVQDIKLGTRTNGLYAPFIAVDEEGGYVARIAHKLGMDTGEVPALIGQSGDEKNALLAGSQIGEYLKEFGFNLNLAPVADVMMAEAPEIGERSYGRDPALVSRMAIEMAQGLRSQGIIPCFKHFPGHGSVSRNAHNVPVSHKRTLAEMEVNELLPFANAIDNDAEMIMMSHLRAVSLDAEYPASLSSIIVTELLRNRMGFDGVVITDALRMGAIEDKFSVKKACLLAIQAGVDILLVPDDGREAYQVLLDAVQDGTITVERIDESVERILALKIKSGLIQ